MKLIPQMSQSDFEEQYLEKSVDFTIPHSMEEIFERVKHSPQEELSDSNSGTSCCSTPIHQLSAIRLRPFKT